MKQINTIAAYADIKDHYYIEQDGTVVSYATGTAKVLKPGWSAPNRTGYRKVTLMTKDGGRKFVRLHRIVALAYLPNPDNKPEVNHIDEDKTNNDVSNLEWTTAKENKAHSRDARVVYQYTRTGELQRTFKSTYAATQAGYLSSAVVACCNNQRKTHAGYIWSYKPLTLKEILEKIVYK